MSTAFRAVVLLLLPAIAGAADVRVLTAADGLPSNWVRALASVDGAIWIGTSEGVAVRAPGAGRISIPPGSADWPSRDVTAVASFAGKVYVGTALDMRVHDGARWERIDTADGAVMRNLSLGVTPDGKELWACGKTMGGGTVKFDGSTWRFMGGEGRGLFNTITSFAFDSKGTWMGSLSGTVYLHKGSDVEYFREGISGSVYALARSGGAIFAGTGDALFRFDGGRWEKVGLPPEWGPARIYSISARGGVLYLGTSGGLARYDGKSAARLTEADGLPSSEVGVVLATSEAILAGTRRGLAEVRAWEEMAR